MTDSKDMPEVIYASNNEMGLEANTYSTHFVPIVYPNKYLLAETSISKADHKKRMDCVVSAADKDMENLNNKHKAQLAELERRFHRIAVLAVKHCSIEHRDWEEVKAIADELDKTRFKDLL